jgi:hypothetical protein
MRIGETCNRQVVAAARRLSVARTTRLIHP